MTLRRTLIRRRITSFLDDWLLGIVVTVAVVGISTAIYVDTSRIQEREAEAAGLCAKLCTERGGMLYWATKKEGFGSANRYCVCADATEVVLP